MRKLKTKETIEKIESHDFFRICEQKVKQNGSMLYFYSDNHSIMILQMWPKTGLCDMYRPDNQYMDSPTP